MVDKRNVNVGIGWAEAKLSGGVWAGNLKTKVTIHDYHKQGRKQQVQYTLEMSPSELEHLVSVLFQAKQQMLESVNKHVGCIGSEFKEVGE